jgi:hypothetical protein
MLIRNVTDISLPVSLEQELHENFNDVTMRTVARIPVILRVGTSHIRVTSVNAIQDYHNFILTSSDKIITRLSRIVVSIHGINPTHRRERHL